MHKNIRFRAVFSLIRYPAFLLLFWSCSGLLLGTLLAASADFSAFSWMRLAVNSRLSIVCHLVLQLLPFLIAAYVVNISGLWLLYTVCFFKLFSFAYVGSLIFIAFGSAGWLVRSLFLFSDIVLLPVFFWYCFKLVKMNGAFARQDFWICASVSISVVLINWLFISPFLARILDI